MTRIKRAAIVAAIVSFAGGAFAQQAGEQWERIGMLAGPITAIAVSPSYQTDGTVWVGVRNGGLWRGQRAGSFGKLTFSWVQLSTIPVYDTVSAIAIVPSYSYPTTTKAVFVGTAKGIAYCSINDYGSIYNQQSVLDNGGNPAPITDMVAWEPSGIQTVAVSSLGGGVKTSANLLASLTTISSSTMNDTRALSVVGSTLYLAYRNSSLVGTVAVYTGTGTDWTEKGTFGGAEPTDLAVDATGHAHLATANRGMSYSTNITSPSTTWSLSCDGSALDTSYRVNAVAMCPQYALDREIFEGRSDGPRQSFDHGVHCAAGTYHAPVTAVAYAPTYHGASTTPCDLFEGTEEGLYLLSCRGDVATRHVQPESKIAVTDIAMAASGYGTWAGSPDGLLRSATTDEMLVYNAFYGDVPEVVAVALSPTFDASASCSAAVDKATLFMAEKNANGLYRSTDKGNSWTLLSSGWLSGARVNDIAVSPLYATDSIVFVATTQGLFKWTGASWDTLSDNSVQDVTHVAVPLSFNSVSFGWVVFSSENSSSKGIWFSTTAGSSPTQFTAATISENDITAIAFSPSFSPSPTGDSLIFASRRSNGTFYTSDAITAGAGACWQSFNLGLNGSALNVRDLTASLSYVSGNVRLVAATEAGPYYWSFDPATQCSGASGSWAVSTLPVPATDRDSNAVAYGGMPNGYRVALGTARKGVYWSADGGVNFSIPATGYRSLPSDVWATVPHPYHDDILFATSPSSGVFVSTTGGGAFWPWNQSSGFCMEGAKGIGVVGSRGCTDSTLDAIWAGAPGALTNNQGIKVRWIQWGSTTGKYNFAYGSWQNTSQSNGSFEQIETMDQGPSSIVRAASAGLGFYETTDCNTSTTWNQNNPVGISTASCVRFGNNLIPAAILKSGTGQGDTVAQGAWVYYAIEVPQGSLTTPIVLTPLSAPDDPDLYVRYGDLPTLTLYDYASSSGAGVTDSVCLNPVKAGLWYIGVYGFSSPSAAFKVSATIDGACTALTSGVSLSGETVDYDKWSYYRISTTASNAELYIEMVPSAGDPDLYVLRGELPTKELWTYRPYVGGLTTESVCIASPGASTWYIGVRGYVSGTSTYSITATRSSTLTCTPTPFGPGQQGKGRFGDGRLPDLRSWPTDDRGGAGVPTVVSMLSAWGTVDGAGVYILSGGSWLLRNGSGWGTLGNLAARSIIQVTSGDLYCGSVGNIYVSKYPDQGQTTWTDVSAYVAGSPGWNITDFLNCSNGDLLVSMNGTYGAGGGIWLTANGGKAWMQLNQGFDASTQSVKDLVNDGGADGVVQYYASTDGSGVYTRTITPATAPTLSSLVPNTGTSAGGTVVSVTGKYYTDLCVTGNSGDCPFSSPSPSPVVWFGGTPVKATFISSTTLQVTTPAHSAGNATVTVMNPDTRESASLPFTFVDNGAGAPTLTVQKSGNNTLLTWTPAGTVTIERATNPTFSQNKKSKVYTGSQWTDPDNVLKDATTYYYRVTSQ